MHDIDDYRNGRQLPGLLIYRYDSPLFFANADDFQRRALAALEDAEHPVRWFVLNIEAISEIMSPALTPLRISGGNWPTETSSSAWPGSKPSSGRHLRRPDS
jgi:MFS superfamily sulfate permease-like transporter